MLLGAKNNTGLALRKHVRSQFKKNVHVSDPKEIEVLKQKYSLSLSSPLSLCLFFCVCVLLLFYCCFCLFLLDLTNAVRSAMRGLSNYFIFEQVKYVFITIHIYLLININIDINNLFRQVNPRFKEKTYEEQEQEYEARVKAKAELYKKSLANQNKSI